MTPRVRARVGSPGSPEIIQTTVWSCNATSCRVVHDPGEPIQTTGSTQGNLLIEAMTAIQFPKMTLSDWIIEAGPGGESFVRYALVD